MTTMSLPDRKNRPLGFESLEAKTSPTTSVVGIGWSDAPVAEQSKHDHLTAERLLQFVAMLEDISVERAMPMQAAADSADHYIADSNPPE